MERSEDTSTILFTKMWINSIATSHSKMGVLLVSMKVALSSNITRRYPCVKKKKKRFKGLSMVESPDVFKIDKTYNR